MKYGYFDDNQKEYVITTPKTPYPWINYLGYEDFFGLISNKISPCWFGKKIEGDIVPVFQDGEKHLVTVYLG